LLSHLLNRLPIKRRRVARRYGIDHRLAKRPEAALSLIPDAINAGILLLAGDRKRESLFPVLGVRNNATIQVLERFSRLGWVNRSSEKKIISEIVKNLEVRTPSLEQPVQFLSGGNQQKVALTRPHLRETVNVILAYEPTQGVDAGARLDIYEALRSKAAQGAAVIVKSSDPIELAGLCDRVVVMSRGQIVSEIQRDDLSEKRIIESIVGGIGFGLKPVQNEATRLYRGD